MLGKVTLGRKRQHRRQPPDYTIILTRETFESMPLGTLDPQQEMMQGGLTIDAASACCEAFSRGVGRSTRSASI
ncbi:SCP2 sterol-binding domain-containing protein [Aurantiacibacter sediminis]|uniref:SCP2 sterol-binding domain-containing protein n=1 Tax=Aurantiacibacter sediminis TaxID=2793064 RepID=A0ABS0N6N3_9SPHN|nr:SCP2 sterol-binding domain-containing protein [Aurantiacibacter sediminis]